MHDFQTLVQLNDSQALTELSTEKRPPLNSTIMEAYRWLQFNQPMQQKLRSELLHIEDALVDGESATNEGALNSGDFMKGLHTDERNRLAAIEAARLESERARKAALLAELDQPGKKHTQNDHQRPVRFMLQSFEESHEYRAKWKNVDERMDRKGKKMKTYKGVSYSSHQNNEGMCSITIQTPRVGIYRVDIEQRFGYVGKNKGRKEESSDANGNANGDDGKDGKRSKIQHALESVEEETGKCVHRLRQIVQRSKWETVAGSPKYIVAKFNISGTKGAGIAAAMQDEKPDEVAEAADFNEEEGEVDFHALHTLVLMDGKKESSGMDGHGHGKRVHRRNSRY